MPPIPLDSEASLAAFLAAFESHKLPKSAWTHAAHVTVAACYLFESEWAIVLPRMRETIRSFNESVGTANTNTAGYHETLTVFWLRVVDRLLNQIQPASRFEAAQQAVAAFGEESRLHRSYYSTDIVADTHARKEWVEPDLQSV